jgi:small subunit ribosomal protein S1
MPNRKLLREIDLSDEVIQKTEQDFQQALPEWLYNEEKDYEPNKVVSGKVLEIRGEEVVIDIGYKSEGVVKAEEWRDETGALNLPKPGDIVDVLIEDVENEDGTIQLSYRKAKRQKEWSNFLQKFKEGDVVTGTVLKKVKGGLLINIGVNAFLPSSQVDIRRPQSLDDYIGKTVECVILKIDEQRRNIVVSRRKLLEDRRKIQKEKLLAELQEGQIRKGIVKNIADFGAFVDLGGIDGLLHVTDMGWHRVTNPHDVVKLDQEIEVYILHIDREKEKIALSLKHKTPSPWENIEQKYPVGSRHVGEVVNIMPYGAFVKLEPGIEGLVHISEMSWVKRINDPREVVNIGDKIEVQVLAINHEKKEISLGIKQCQVNPWDEVTRKYPPGSIVTGTVKNLTSYGAFIEIEEGIEGLLHVSDMSHVRKVSNPAEVLQKGQQITCVVLNVDQERKRVGLGLKQMSPDPWETDIPNRYRPGQKCRGRVTKLTNFGVFVELEPGLEGLLHISELADHKVESPEEVVQVGQEVEVKVLRVDPKERKIGLSMRNVDDGRIPEESPASDEPAADTAPRSRESKRELRGGTGSAGPLIQLPSEGTKPTE